MKAVKLIKRTYKNPMVNIILYGERLNGCPPKFRNKERMTALTTLIQQGTRSFIQGDKERKEKAPISKRKK